MKQSGAFISSKLTPPKEGSSISIQFTNLSISELSTSRSIESMSANFLNRTAFPSITGFDASAPISPRPSTAVPFVTTAIKFPFEVYSYALDGSFAISSHGTATPGE